MTPCECRWTRRQVILAARLRDGCVDRLRELLRKGGRDKRSRRRQRSRTRSLANSWTLYAPKKIISVEKQRQGIHMESTSSKKMLAQSACWYQTNKIKIKRQFSSLNLTQNPEYLLAIRADICAQNTKYLVFKISRRNIFNHCA